MIRRVGLLPAAIDQVLACHSEGKARLFEIHRSHELTKRRHRPDVAKASSQCARLLAVPRAALNEETVEPGTVLCENIVQTNLLVGRLIKFLRARVNRYGHTLLHEVAARPSVRLGLCGKQLQLSEEEVDGCRRTQ